MANKQINTTYDTTQTLLGEVVAGVRVDELPINEADKIAGAGKFAPLTVDKDGYLRVRPREGIEVGTASLSDLIEQQNQILRKILHVLCLQGCLQDDAFPTYDDLPNDLPGDLE